MKTINVERPEETITRITLDRPDHLNAFTHEMIDEVVGALREASRDRRCRAIILTGAGRAFSAGVDLKRSGVDRWLEDRDPIEGRVEWAEYLTSLFNAVRRTSKPVIAAVNGPAVGGGFALALTCELRIGGTAAMFADGFIRNGLSGCELGTSYLLPRLIGAGRANELMLTGRAVEAPEAEQIGLLNRVVANEQLQDEAVRLAASIAEHSPFAVAMTKQIANANLEATSLDNAILLEMRTQMLAVHTTDSREARDALLGKRSPDYTGYRTS
ncbi:enoyl-CoA hydratase/isomerase family protein [Saccharopolyspora elongata]|uniref:Enoyl-CoA hydratase/isomerase family protein n=1 Tax=Saccharopolyspora elongata TaxID=2530387 RepID=A0A4R4Z4K9_9PSEU|nr:enoyl-CoA hydratase-related protein [Saccharopolyspora elongata]TDD52806.1 enoyl-CoA hydratase/isomerase family protein [Saccharopolyspora elongata]